MRNFVLVGAFVAFLFTLFGNNGFDFKDDSGATLGKTTNYVAETIPIGGLVIRNDSQV